MIKQSRVWLLITAVLFLSVQILAVVIYIYSFIPYPAFWSDPFLKGVDPNRDPFFYELFLIMAIVLMVLGFKWLYPGLSSPETRRKLKLWLVLEGFWCFLMVFCFFKWTTYRYLFWNVLPVENSTWLQPFFCATCGLALLSKIFFPEINKFYSRIEIDAGCGFLSRWPLVFSQVIFIGAIIVLLFIPKPQDVAALGLVWDQWDHLDQTVGWFVKHGWYFNYEQTIQILVLLAIAYLVGLFYFIRLWLNSWLLAAIGVLLSMKMGMFYYATTPCVWINPANSFLAHGWDLLLFFGLWYVSIKYPKKFYSVAALAGAVLIYFWFKSYGYIDALGLDNQPMMAPLRVRQFFPYFMGFFIPVFYVMSLLVLMGQQKNQSSFERRLPIVIGIYGLMIFVDYLEHPMIGFYGSLMVPSILIMLWWLKQIFLSSSVFVKRMSYAVILLFCFGALLTNRLMLIYPNIIFQNSERFAKERVFYDQFKAITSSSTLIQQLTRPQEKVVLLSNFETALLMQAQRQPLFKDFPVMSSSLNNDPAGLSIKTKKQCLALINSMAEENAEYVFVDARLLALSTEALGNSGLKAVLNYIRDHYQVYSHQGFLVALQRR